MKPTISTSRDSPYLSPKTPESPMTRCQHRAAKPQENIPMLSSFKHVNTEANPELNRPLAQSAHQVGSHYPRSDFVLPSFIKKVQEITLTSESNSLPILKEQPFAKDATKSPKFSLLSKPSITNRSRKMSYNQQSLVQYSPKFEPGKSQIVTNEDSQDSDLPQTRDRKLSYQVSAQNIHSQISFTKKQSHTYWPMSPNNDTIRRQSDLLPGMASGRNNFLQESHFHPKNNQNANFSQKIGANDEAKYFFPSFKNKKARKNSENQNTLQKDAKFQAVPSFLLKKIHKQNDETKPQQNVQILKEQTEPLSLSARKNVKDKKFSLKDFVMIKQLGEGKFGKVLLVREKATGFTCAMKVFKKSQIQGDNFIEQFIREMKIQMFMNHPNVIKMYGYFDDLSFIYILLEVAVEGTLFSFLDNMHKKEKTQGQVESEAVKQTKKSGLTGLSVKETAVIMYQICLGINYLHSNNIIHRDLKPQNKTIKLCDFGWSVFKGSQMRTTFCGTPLYLCPQLITGEQYDQKVDIWAIGIMLYEFLIGPNPFNIKQESDLVNIIQQELVLDKNDPNFIKKLDSTVVDFINGCLNKDPIERLDIREIVNHEFFKKHCPQIMIMNGSSSRSIVWDLGK